MYAPPQPKLRRHNKFTSYILRILKTELKPHKKTKGCFHHIKMLCLKIFTMVCPLLLKIGCKYY